MPQDTTTDGQDPESPRERSEGVGAKVVLVTGMHRSGTSALMGALGVLGVKIPGLLAPPDETNPKGYWEPKEVNDAHDTLLAELQCAWNDPRPLPPGWLTSEAARGCRRRIVELVRRECATAPLWGVKDPRLCLLLPLWLPLVESLGGTPYILHIYRHPDEVAASLDKRQKLPVQAPYELWLRYVLDAEHDSRPYRRAFVSYQELLEDWRAALGGAGQRLGLSWPVGFDEAGEEIDAFVSRELWHERARAERGERRSAAEQGAQAVYEALEQAAGGDEQALVGAAESQRFPKPRRPAAAGGQRRNTADFDTPDAVRAIAFYLPQYHRIPENDEWWGKGFTEWIKVSRAKPQFAGHYQPHLPADLGFYDLSMPQVRAEQAELARQFGISGFCYYHYWFGGKRLLERPFEEVLNSGEPDFPFCLCWANENWTRRWDGKDEDVLIAQRYSPQDDADLIRSVIPAFRDPRYIRVHGRPLFIVYRPALMPDPSETLWCWRNECIAAGVGDPYLCMVQSFGSVDPRPLAFDAAIEFPPHNIYTPRTQDATLALAEIPLRYAHPFEGDLFFYGDLVNISSNRPNPPFTWFRGVSPSWDNTARRGSSGVVFHGSDPYIYSQWLQNMVQWTREHRPPGERLIFLNAWNEWGEGCHLEPDAFFGALYLEATRQALYDDTDQILHDALEHLQGGRLAEAEILYQRALVRQPNHPFALHVLGLINHQSGDPQRAIELIERAIAAKPDFAEACKNAANLYVELDQLDQALDRYRMALAIAPDMLEAHFNLAAVYDALDRPEEAARHYRQALLLNPDLDQAQQRLEQLQQHPASQQGAP